jgi:signal transduction histidine kinase
MFIAGGTSLLVRRVRAESDVPRRIAAYDQAMPRATDLRRFLRAGRGYLLNAAVALVLVFLSAPRGTPAVADHVVRVWWIFSAVMVAGLLVQHRWPLLALVLATVGATAHQLAFDSTGPRVGFPTLLELAVPITLYTLASRTRSRRISMAALAVILVAELAVNIINPMIADTEAPPAQRVADSATTPAKGARQPDGVRPTQPMASFSEIQEKFVRPGLSVLLAVALAFALGDGQRTRRAHLRTLQQRAADLEREQHQRVALATASERARLSRELHDVTAHGLSMIVAQAQAAMAAQRRHPERSTQAMREVVTVGRDSLSEMRRLVGALGPSQDLAPSPGIVALPALADRVRAAGTPVRLDVDGGPGNLPAVVDLSAYRIVQEALTNTVKHAGAGAEARVRLAVHAEYVDVAVTDDGAGSRAGSPTEHGNGLRGIAERVHLLGGALTVGPEADGGFAVRARLPIAPTDRAQPEPIGGHA